ncbi:nuclease [Fragilaria crotonensis]|nr:nuclease [Fragilaria crotonensis]
MGQPSTSFPSGHYGVFGLNVQAVVCDIQCCFMFFGVVAPGKCGNQVAFERSLLFEYINELPDGYYAMVMLLFEYIKELPDGYFINGYAAYSVGEKMLTPFTGAGHRSDLSKDAYNLFLSQLQIRIEMSFGPLTNEWRILQAPLQTSLQLSSEILISSGRLHETPTPFLQVLNPNLARKLDGDTLPQ